MFVSEEDFMDILDIGITLSTEKNYGKLLDLLLTKAMKITSCDGGVLYLRQDSQLNFKILRFLSKHISKQEGDGSEPIPPISLMNNSLLAYSSNYRKVINIEDVTKNNRYDLTELYKSDLFFNYKTKSLFIIPLVNRQNEDIGVLVLVNAQNKAGEIVPFSYLNEKILLSLSSQAAIAISSIQYFHDMNELFYSFVSAMASIIDQRTPYNGNHTRNVARYADGFVNFLNKKYKEQMYSEKFNNNRKEQLIMAANLHDIGKMVIPLEIMNKSNRLETSLLDIQNRFKLIKAYLKIDYLEKKINRSSYQSRVTYLENSLALIQKLNTLGELPDNTESKIIEIAETSYNLSDGSSIPYLTDYEKDCLLIKHGTLTESERKIMESHVIMTSKILENIHFNKYFKKVPIWAGAHHEFLDGSGYPNGLTKENMPTEIRILAMLDIFDALTASDRPYKKPVPVVHAIAILHSMADEGKLDKTLVTLFGEFMLEGYN